ncbi:indolepyruvate ferredoxin oxidoreductase family protein [Thalassospira xianhensis]|uniref:Indolepyruvate ferredoxin oxidoreductase n=1 Tax=Thalassospira xianhensis MCCC 1A02616 TaxID=1177929 RepID=A0A367U7R2_9PROT|nr:indolepyruvate ferredoxin oxidoreductase family protein [Thalassospira xianhensis]RCK04346.1 indolepyruvate ferredoxin oxidoreductase [Thalassospira xianhensis MCCC 1A02616]
MAQLAAISLDDKYTLEEGRVYLTGIQALVRLPLMQRQLDARAGLNTAGCISGYRGSPLGGLDQQLWRAKKFLTRQQIEFQAGVNEDLAATVVWGSQQVNMYKDAKYDGVFGMWYGKGPGVDRSGDVFKHANYAGTSKHGGVLVLAGDDHSCKSSTLPHQTEYAFIDAQIPVLNPSGVQDILDFGIHGWAMSRYSGCWVAMKTIAETVESSAAVDVAPDRITPIIPDNFAMPEGGLHIRWPDTPKDQEHRLMKYKLYAALAYARANKLNKTVIDSPNARLGIITTGKAYLDVMQAFDDLGISEADAAKIGIRVLKVGMSWPLNRDDVREFAMGLEEIIVVEEKRAVMENQVKEQLYNWREDVRPTVIGKFDEKGEWILPSMDELTPARIAVVLAERIKRFYDSPKIHERIDWLEQKEREIAEPRPDVARIPWFCPGCPHNSSTKVPEGSRAMAGIGCHYMVNWMDRSTETFTHMGGEGVTWIGQAPFTNTKHVFQNLGDGTYYHSGSLAVRAAVAAGVNITYKILFNDAVAMTGGQPVDGPLTVPQITRQMADEGVKRIIVLSDEPYKYPVASHFADGVDIRHRDELDNTQKELREIEGVTILIFDQTCAAEKRRRRKRKLMVDPPKRVFINDLVCEGCGDCGEKSNCLAVVPVETEFGRKRAIDQSACNKDFSCLNGFCPSFVTIEGGSLRKPEAAAKSGNAGDAIFASLPRPTLPDITDPWSVLITGVGGTGVVTIGALLGMAAHIEGKGIVGLDMAGLAQKGGAVVSHIRFADTQEKLHAARIPAGEANVVLGCDLLVAASFEGLAKMRRNFTQAVINTHETVTGAFTRNPDFQLKSNEHMKVISDACGADAVNFVEGSDIATRLMGNSIATNLFMLGVAWQRGLIPITEEALMQAIDLNGVAIDMNKQSFYWGRLFAHDPKRVLDVIGPNETEAHPIATTLSDIIAKRKAFLTDYQNAAYANRFAALVDRVAAAEKRLDGGDDLARTVAKYYFKLLAYKDEYEVARLYTDPAFRAKLAKNFTGDYKIRFHLAPPALADRDPETGHLKKQAFGPWMMNAFGILAKFKFLRGTALDPFGRTHERKMERQLIADYEALVDEVITGLNHDNARIANALLALPEQIRGYGHIKDGNIDKVKTREAELLEQFRNPPEHLKAAE